MVYYAYAPMAIADSLSVPGLPGPPMLESNRISGAAYSGLVKNIPVTIRKEFPETFIWTDLTMTESEG